MGIDVSLYLSHLLFRNNVAILPGFGAFVATTTPALIDHARGMLMPPSKVLTFNANLKINDGFLINLIRHKHGITAHEARAVIENFVKSIEDILRHRDTVRLDSIGKLYLNNNSNIIFEPDTKANFNANTFGLPAVQYYALSRNANPTATTNSTPLVKPSTKPLVVPMVATNVTETTPIPEVAAVPTVEVPPIVNTTPETPVVGWWNTRKYLAAAAVLGLTATAALWQYNKNETSNGLEAKVVPTSDVRVNVGPNGKSNGEEIAEIPVNQDSIKLYNDAITAQQEAEAAKEKAVTSPPIAPPITKTAPTAPSETIAPSETSKQFTATLLIGSFSSHRNAKKAERRLRRKGFTTYNKTFNGLRRVGAIVHYNSENEKTRYINRLRKIFGNTVWQLEK
jgi:nucleoid DNA-binding protein